MRISRLFDRSTLVFYCVSSFQEDMHACGSMWGRVVGLNSKATSFADSIDKIFGVSSPKSHTSLDSYVPKCMHAYFRVLGIEICYGHFLFHSSHLPSAQKYV